MSNIRVGIIGCGGIAGKHGREYAAHPDCEVVALADVNEAGMQRIASAPYSDAKNPPAFFKDHSALLTDGGVDAVSICTPHTMHFDHCSEALDAGCHVLVEKPMVTNLKDAVALEKKIEASGKIFSIGYNTPCSNKFTRLREIVRTEEFGKLQVISLAITQNWIAYCLKNSAWRLDPALAGGGMIYDSGAHVMNSLVWAVESDVEEVHAFVDNKGNAVDVNGTVNIRFANGVMATVAVCGDGGDLGHSVWMFEKGVVEIDPWGASWLKIRPLGGDVDDNPQLPGEDKSPMTNFIDAILGRDEPRTTARHGIYQSQLMDGVYSSVASGQSVKLSSL